MDLMIMGIVAVLVSIISTLAAVIAKRSKWKLLAYAVVGLVIGIAAGYFITPFIISFL